MDWFHDGNNICSCTVRGPYSNANMYTTHVMVTVALVGFEAYQANVCQLGMGPAT